MSTEDHEGITINTSHRFRTNFSTDKRSERKDSRKRGSNPEGKNRKSSKDRTRMNSKRKREGYCRIRNGTMKNSRQDW